jgi:hypothetical protein
MFKIFAFPVVLHDDGENHDDQGGIYYLIFVECC